MIAKLTHSKSLYLVLFAIFFLFYLSITGGNFWESDSRAVYEATKSIVDRLDFSTPCFGTTQAADGNCYSQYGLFMSIAIIPFYLVEKFFREVLVSSYFFPGFFSSLTNVFITSLLLLLVFNYLRRFNFTFMESFFGIVLLGLATYLPAYTKTLFAEPLITLLILLAFYLLLFSKRESKTFFLAGLIFGLAVLTKIAVVIFSPCILFIFLFKKYSLKNLLVFSLAFGVCIIIFFGYNFARFGDILDTGYRGIKLDNPILYGLYLHIFSTGKSLFLYQPIILFAFFGFKNFYKSGKNIFLLFAMMTAINFLFYSIYMHPTGDLAWGSRYLYPTLPFFIFSLMFFLKHNRNYIIKRIFIVVLIVSVMIQLSSAYLSYHRYYAYLNGKIGADYLTVAYNQPENSPLWGQWKMIFRIGYKDNEKAYWDEAFQESLHTGLSTSYLVAPTDMFFIRSKREIIIFILILIIIAVLIRKLVSKEWNYSK